MSSPSHLFIGVDGGGTKTALTLLDAAGSTLAQLTVGSTNPNSVGIEGAKKTMTEGIHQIIQNTGSEYSVQQVRNVVLSISGCNSVADAIRMEGWISDLFPTAVNFRTLTSSSSSSPSSSPSVSLSDASSSLSAPIVTAYNDSIAALVSGTEGVLDGIVLISGTGMICKGFRPTTGENGSSVVKEATSCGNGALIDSGSGYSLGIGVLKVAFASEDGMGPKSILNQAALKYLNLSRTEELVDWLYADRSWDRVASLAILAFHYGSVAKSEDATPLPGLPPLPKTESEVDQEARRLLEEGAQYLSRSIQAVAARLEFARDDNFTVSVHSTRVKKQRDRC